MFTGSVLPGVSVTDTNAPGYGWAARATSTITPTWINELGYNFSYGAVVSRISGLISSQNSPNVKPALPFGVSLGRIPTLAGTGFSSVTGFGPYDDFNRNHQVFDNLTKQWGRHTLKMGVTYNYYQKTENAGGNNTGNFSSFSSTPRPTGTAANLQQWANFLLGNVAAFSQVSQDITPDIRAKQFETYLQDDYRMKPNLTINAGLRYSFFPQPTDATHQLVNFDPAVWSAANAPKIDPATGNKIAGTGDLLNGLIVGGKNSPYGDKVGADSYLYFSPRIGIAWDPFKDGKTSIRTGYGIAYDTTAYGPWETNMFNDPPIVNTATIPNTRLDNPAAGTASISLLPIVVRGTPNKTMLPYTQQWSFDVQREIKKGFLLDVGYFGNRATHLLTNVDLALIKPGVVAASGIFPAGTLVTSANTPRLAALRPYPGYATINSLQNVARSSYHSLQVSARGTIARDSTVRISYTWAKNLTDSGTDATSVQDPYNRHNDWGRAPIDRTQVLTVSYIYSIPFLRGQTGWMGNAFGGWQVSGITTIQTGLPLTVSSGQGIDWGQEGLLGSSLSGPRPDLIANPNANAPHTIAKFFNTAAFADVPAGVVRPGNAGRNIVQGPGMQVWSFSGFKKFKLRESVSLQLRADLFNLWNHTNLQTLGLSYATGSTVFGTVTATRDSRVAQLALRLSF